MAPPRTPARIWIASGVHMDSIHLVTVSASRPVVAIIPASSSSTVNGAASSAPLVDGISVRSSASPDEGCEELLGECPRVGSESGVAARELGQRETDQFGEDGSAAIREGFVSGRAAG